MRWLIVAGGLSLASFGQGITPIPRDPLELVTGQITAVDTAASRGPVLQLLARARTNYAVRSAGQGYDLKVAFMVNSGGQTDYDGPWEMEDMFDPQQGFRWTAKAGAAYTTTQIALKQAHYGEGTGNVIPLRLQEARAALFDPIPSGNLDRVLIRTSTASFNGAEVTCVLLSTSGNAAAAGRRWDESEECIDARSGLLQVHSQAPGRYYAYDYLDAPQFAGHMLPRKVIVTEAGKTVSEIRVESLAALPSADPALFVPSEEMKARGAAVAMAGAQKISRFSAPGPLPPGATVQPVCVFGLVTPSGQLVEAHSLQPSDPNSQAAVDAAKQIKFPIPAQPGARPQQYFVFVIEKFVSSR